MRLDVKDRLGKGLWWIVGLEYLHIIEVASESWYNTVFWKTWSNQKLTFLEAKNIFWVGNRWLFENSSSFQSCLDVLWSMLMWSCIRTIKKCVKWQSPHWREKWGC